MTDSNRVPNRLINEKSPYLLQHAYNPVDWYPWSEDAFNKAKSEDKPVFLSIGYSTCHWCHVMAHESFEDRDAAELLNQYFVCIKVDREERPDVDHIYMSVCQALTGSGGWPLTVLMTPEQKPFWAGTYLPKRTEYGRMGLIDLLSAIRKQWSTDRNRLTEASEQITSFLKSHAESAAALSDPNKELIMKGVEAFKNSYDEKWGGFGNAPKFPVPHNLLFLLRYSVLEDDISVRNRAEHTLLQMFRGGIFDHISGGFSRYSTDEKWLVPHFEKMLYDNALLAYTYLEAFQITRRPLYQRIVERTLEYVLNELTDDQGGFYCGQDADSDGAEGEYYLFAADEIRSVLGKDDGEIFIKWFGVTEKGNFEGRNILNLINNPQYEEKNSHIENLCKKLYDYRLTRTRLHKDDKVLTSWNALMMSAMAKAGRLLDKPIYLKAAQRAQTFIERNLMDSEGELMIRWRKGEAAHTGQLDDYAFYVFALLEMYAATFQVCYLQKAESIAEKMLDLFWDRKNGGFYFYSYKGEQLISRPKEIYDGALPSGNSVAAVVLEQLYKLTGSTKWQKASQQQMQFISGSIQTYPAGYTMSLIALLKVLYPSRELVCVTGKNNEIPIQLLKYLNENGYPNLTAVLKTSENQRELTISSPFTEGYPIPENGELYYLCQNGACASPVAAPELLKA